MHGKGKFDYWTVRLPVSRIVFELKGDVHEKVAREAFSKLRDADNRRVILVDEFPET
jgi:ribosomal protein L16/L10AE